MQLLHYCINAIVLPFTSLGGAIGRLVKVGGIAINQVAVADMSDGSGVSGEAGSIASRILSHRERASTMMVQHEYNMLAKHSSRPHFYPRELHMGCHARSWHLWNRYETLLRAHAILLMAMLFLVA
jgi:hypothetical protein